MAGPMAPSCRPSLPFAGLHPSMTASALLALYLKAARQVSARIVSAGHAGRSYGTSPDSSGIPLYSPQAIGMGIALKL